MNPDARLIVQGPVEGSLWVVAVSTAGIAIDLSAPAFSGLGEAVRNNTPLEIVAETSAIYYRGAVASGTIDGTQQSAVGTATADQAAFVKFSDVPANYLDRFPGNTTHILARAAGATGILRIRKAG